LLRLKFARTDSKFIAALRQPKSIRVVVREPVSVKEIFPKQFNGLQLDLNLAGQRASWKLSTRFGAGLERGVTQDLGSCRRLQRLKTNTPGRRSGKDAFVIRKTNAS
jgi:hypothetical protein